MLHAKITSGGPQRAGDDRRAGTDRLDIGKPSTVRADRFAPLDVVVEDLSSSGFLFRSDARIAPGAMLHVGLGGGGMAEAKVVRIDGDRVGCEFLVPLTVEQLRSSFAGGTVTDGAFPSIAASPLPLHRDDKLPGAARLAIVAGGGALAWLAVIGVATLVFR